MENVHSVYAYERLPWYLAAVDKWSASHKAQFWRRKMRLKTIYNGMANGMARFQSRVPVPQACPCLYVQFCMMKLSWWLKCSYSPTPFSLRGLEGIFLLPIIKTLKLMSAEKKNATGSNCHHELLDNILKEHYGVSKCICWDHAMLQWEMPD